MNVVTSAERRRPCTAGKGGKTRIEKESRDKQGMDGSGSFSPWRGHTSSTAPRTNREGHGKLWKF